MRKIISLLFFVSGITGLVYEVLWAKYLALYLGSTAQAHAVVLGTFLGGLALGNALLGPLVDRIGQRLKLYGWLEMGIGVFGVLTPILFPVLSKFYLAFAQDGTGPTVALSFLRISLASGCLLIPTMLMGGTLPALSRFATRSQSELEPTVALFYFLNSAGAALGAVLAGFFLIPSFGLDASVTITAIANIAIGIIALILGALQPLEIPAVPAAAETKSGPASSHIWIAYVTVFVSGFVSLSYEIAWIRLLTLVLGSSTYSFSLMLAAFIAGIALGSLWITRPAFAQRDSYLLFGLAEIAVAASICLTLPLYERLPYYFLQLDALLTRAPASFAAYQGVKFFLCFCLMLLPTMFLGMTLPLATNAVTADFRMTGTNVGRVFSLNTLGNVLGALLAGLLLLPLLGIRNLILAGVLVNFGIGFWVLVTTASWGWKRKATVLSSCLLLFIACLGLLPPWNYLILSGGLYRRHVNAAESYDKFKESYKNFSLLFYRDDSNVTVSVLRDNLSGHMLLKVNGKTDASSGTDLSTQVLLAQVPLLLKTDAQDVLVIGLGSGVTAGSALCHPIRHLDVVEISPAVVQASKLFSRYNRNALKDPRCRMYLEDAKTFLARIPHRYDAIISEPSNPWMSGIGNLFSEEFYRQALTHLNPGGLMVQWFHTYEMTDPTVAMVLRTFSAVFGHVSLWTSGGNDLLLIGAAGPLSVDLSQMQEHFGQEPVRQNLQNIGINRLPTFLSLEVAADSTVRQMAGGGRHNKDLFPILEYQAPKDLFLGLKSGLVAAGDERIGVSQNKSLLLPKYLKQEKRRLSAEDFRNMAHFYRPQDDRFLPYVLSEWIRHYPWDPNGLWESFLYYRKQGSLEIARRLLRRLLKLRPDNPDYWEIAGDLEFELYSKNASYLGRLSPKRALHCLQLSLAAGAANGAKILLKMAQIHRLKKNYGEAMALYEKAIERAEANPAQDPKPDDLLLEAAQLALQMGNRPKALDFLARALQFNPKNAAAAHMQKDLS